ncbi:uncharacterized protein zgc:113263 [Periophthalmus magnuspinnatus]|uniref:uncharacterized protein zgc:113263 n=1 Tax=Periophthalmus magnuspinnatus TaxID=409849 RepID=UPI00145AEB9A|nr:uncharacterized protein zgc:113263 [Periophthalmus magnuspinnatus]
METKHEDENESRQGNGLPMRYLRLLAPPLQLLSATMWQVVQQGLVQHYGMLEEFVTMVTELVPELMSYNQRAQLILGLRARLVLEMCRGEEPLDTNDIQNHLDRIKAPSTAKDQPEHLDRVEESQVKFVELVHSLLKNSSKRKHFFQDIFPDYYGPKFDTALEMLVWEFITRLEELLPAPDFTQVAALLGDAPCLLEDCLQSFFAPEEMKAVVEHHRNLGFFEEKDSRLLPMDDCILSALSLPSEATPTPDSALLELTPNPELDHQRNSSIDQSLSPSKTNEPANADIGDLTSSMDDVSKSSQVTGGRVLRKRKQTDYKDIPRKQPAKALPHRNSSADEDNSSDSPLISIWGDYTDSPKPSVGSDSKVHWSDEETVILLDVWGMNVVNPRRLKNRQLLSQISHKLCEHGYRRTPEQCKSRIKRLRRYFTQVSSSVNGKVECKFYDQLERILSADPDSTCDADDGDEEENQEMDDDLQFIEQNLPLDISTDMVSSSARTTWSDSETLALINIWGENKHQVGSSGGHRGAQLFNIVSKKMAALGYFRTPDQCQTRMKRLKSRFRQSYDSNCVGGGQDRVFSELARFMPRDHSLEDEVDRALEELQDDDLSAYFNQDLDAVFNLQEERKKVTWSDKETVLLLEIWGDPQVQQDLKRFPHNSPFYNEIAEKLAGCGYRRSADQCYTRIKRLKALYRNCLDRLDKGGVKSDFKFYNILEKILGSQPSTSSTPSTPSTKVTDTIEISEDSNSDSVPEIDGVSLSTEMGYWSDVEVRTLIDIWAEEEVKKSLTGEVQNGQMYSNIIQKMMALGFSKTYNQCCLKVKELRNNFHQCYERKKAGKVVEYRFYDQLEPILEPLMEDPDEKDEETENRPVADSVSSVWEEPETIAFLQIWAADDIQQNLKSSFRNGRIYAEISEKMSTLGYHKSAEQCHDHITKLKKNYRRYCRGGSRRTVFPYLHIMAPVLGGLGFSSDADAAAFDSNQDVYMDKDQDVYEQPSTSQPMSDQGKKATWSDTETRLLLKIWGEDRIQMTLKGSLKNRHVYDHISTALSEYGFTRSADQCYTRIKRLKAGYHHEKADFRYYKELQEILQKQPKADTSFEEVPLPDMSLPDLSFSDMSFIEDPDPNKGVWTGDGTKVIWSDKETKVLLDIWASEAVQQNLKGSTKNKHIFEQISRAMMSHGYMRSADQCQSRIKRLRAGFKSAIDGRKGGKQEVKFFNHLMRAFGNKYLNATTEGVVEDGDF